MSIRPPRWVVNRRRASLAARLGAAMLVAAAPAQADQSRWTLTSLDWPPYAGADLPGQGAAIQVLREALATQGIDLAVRFRPWERARVEARNDSAVLGYYPAWPAEVTSGFFASQPVFRSPIGLAERRDAPVAWQDVGDLAGQAIGVVDGYIYPKAFQALVAAGEIQAVETRNATTALELVGLGRVAAAAVDRYVMAYQLKRAPALAPYRDILQLNATILSRQEVVVAWEGKPANRKRAKRLDQALGAIEPRAIIGGYLDALEPEKNPGGP